MLYEKTKHWIVSLVSKIQDMIAIITKKNKVFHSPAVVGQANG